MKSNIEERQRDAKSIEIALKRDTTRVFAFSKARAGGYYTSRYNAFNERIDVR